MEYTQITLNDWLEMKQKLRRELIGVKKSFVRIGFVLRQIDEQRLYEQDGYKSIAEFAEAEYGLEQSTTSKFMSINREYSIEGYSEILRPEFEDFNRSQLEEMLKLPADDRRMIQPETPRGDIRQLKKFNRSEPETGIADDIRQLVEKFYEDNPDILNAVISNPEFDQQTVKRFAEIVNPGGNKSYKKGLFFLMMYENHVAVKKFGSTPQDMTWWEFYLLTKEIFGGKAAGAKTWENYFGEGNAPAHKAEGKLEKEAAERAGAAEGYTDLDPEDEPEPEDGQDKEEIRENEPEVKEEPAKDNEKVDAEESVEDGAMEEDPNLQDMEDKAAEPEGIEDPENAPAQNYAGIRNEEADKAEDTEADHFVDTKEEPEEEPEMAAAQEAIPGQLEITKDFPEYCPEESIEPEPVKQAYASRLLYMASKGHEEAAAYMAESMEKQIRKMNNVSFNVLAKASFWEAFFGIEVDKEGREIECV